MGIHIQVYRGARDGDLTAGGISGRHSELTVVNIDGPCEPTHSSPAVILQKNTRGTVRLVPARFWRGEWVRDEDPDRYHLVFGGNYGAVSDSRFRQAIEALTECPFYGAVAIHDRRQEYPK